MGDIHEGQASIVVISAENPATEKEQTRRPRKVPKLPWTGEDITLLRLPNLFPLNSAPCALVCAPRL